MSTELTEKRIPRRIWLYWSILALGLGTLIVLMMCVTPALIAPALTAKQQQNRAHVERAMTQHRLDESKRAQTSQAQRLIANERNDRVIDVCRIAARKQSRHPSTVNMRYFEASAPRHDGLILVTGILNAANSFGLRLDHDVTCLIAQGKVQLITVAEVR